MPCCGKTASTSPTNPKLIGDPDGIVTRVRATVNFRGLKASETAWVTGTGVQAYVDQNILVVK